MEVTGINLVLTVDFTDKSTRAFTLAGMEQSAVGYLRSRIWAINRDMPTNFARTFVSNSGAQATKISAAKVVTTEEEVIYSAAS